MKFDIKFDRDVLSKAFVEIIQETKDMDSVIKDLTIDNKNFCNETEWVLTVLERASMEALDIDVIQED